MEQFKLENQYSAAFPDRQKAEDDFKTELAKELDKETSATGTTKNQYENAFPERRGAKDAEISVKFIEKNTPIKEPAEPKVENEIKPAVAPETKEVKPEIKTEPKPEAKQPENSAETLVSTEKITVAKSEVPKKESQQGEEDIKAIKQRFIEGWKKFAKEQLAKGKSPEEIKLESLTSKSLKDFIDRPDKDGSAARPKFEKKNTDGAEPETDTEFYKAINKNLNPEVHYNLIDKAINEAKREFDAEKNPAEEQKKESKKPAEDKNTEIPKEEKNAEPKVEAEKAPEDKRDVETRFAEVKVRILEKARALAEARRMGKENYKKAFEEWAEADREYSKLEKEMNAAEGGQEGAINPVRVEMRKTGADVPAKKEKWWNPEKKEKVWGWTKERLKGFATFGFWEVHRAEQFRSAKRKAGKELAKGAENVKKIENLSLEDAWEEASRIQANLLLEGKPEGRGAKTEDYGQLSDIISIEKASENYIYVNYAVKNAENHLRKRLEKYSDEFGKKPDESKIKGAMEALRDKMMEFQDGAKEADTKDFSKIIKEKIDPKYVRRYLYAGAEAALGFSGWAWVSDKAASWWYGSEKIAGGAAEIGARAAENLSDKVPMDQNIWHTVREYLTNNGISDPSNGQILEGSKLVAEQNGIGVAEWGTHGVPMDTVMQQGHLLKMSELAKNLIHIKGL